MPGFLLDMSALVMCDHMAKAQATVANPRVRLSGQPAVGQLGPWVIAGCPNPPPLPCISGVWATGSLRVKSLGQPLLVKDSQAVCVPSGGRLTPQVTQVRVKAQ